VANVIRFVVLCRRASAVVVKIGDIALVAYRYSRMPKADIAFDDSSVKSMLNVETDVETSKGCCPIRPREPGRSSDTLGIA